MTADIYFSFQGNTIFVKGIGLTEKVLQESFTKFGEFVFELGSRGNCYLLIQATVK